MMRTPAEVVLEAIAAVESRDDERLARVSHPDVSFHWPEPLRPQNLSRGDDSAVARTFEELWDPFQPTIEERRMSPRVVASAEKEVAVLWHQRGVNADGERIDCEVLGLYETSDGLLTRGQMFYFDCVAVRRFLETKPAR